MTLHSGIYEGWIRHRRYIPRLFQFRYRVFMLYLDLEETGQVLSLSRCWSRSALAPARFVRSDFLGDAAVPLRAAVNDIVQDQTGRVPAGPVRMLANLRYFGFSFNPLVTYYCFDKNDEYVEFIVAEVTNTPWREKQAYVLTFDRTDRQYVVFRKRMHVSPFNGMDMDYHWHSTVPAECLSIHIVNRQDQRKVTDATLMLKRRELSASELNRMLLRFPFLTLINILRIYWSAWRLWLGGNTYIAPPGRIPD